MNVGEAIAARRSIKRFADRAVTREEIEQLLDAAVLAPNHRLTQPWRFYVLGPDARRAYGAALGARKARRVEDAAAAQLVLDKVAGEHAALPAMIVVAMTQDENPEIRQEDYAAVMMAVQNMTLVATGLGLGTHVKTGAVMDDPAARAAAGVPEGERIVAVLNVGEPAEVPTPKERADAAAHTTWLPLFAGVLLAAGCASSPGAEVEPMVGQYGFSGTVEGRNETRYGFERFTVPVSGSIDIDRDGRVSLNSDRGSCEHDARQARQRAGTLSVSCPRISVTLSEYSGTVTILVSESREVRGECRAWETLPNGQRGRCTEYDWRERRTQARRTGPISVTKNR
jgi:nitroreductase